MDGWKNETASLEQSFENINLTDSLQPDGEQTNNFEYSDNHTASDINTKSDEIRAALKQQTLDLYLQYAREQYPKDSDKRDELIKEMEEQYFTHYLFEVHEFQVTHQKQQIEQLKTMHSTCTSDDSALKTILPIPESLPLIPATVWTSNNITDFKREMWQTQRECCIKISSLATATIRVPTHVNGKRICWQFATDSYDLGFGLYFEWDLDLPVNISVNISESSDEEDDDDDNEDDDEEYEEAKCYQKEKQEADPNVSTRDLESGHNPPQPRVPTDELIPVYRRDCHLRVYCGTHVYPGYGIYVFKFDNSFSLWRSKWLYYRIYYSD